jgi:FkbM family methyltransferase
MKKTLLKFLRKMGILITRYPDYDYARRMKMVNYYNIDTLLDIGANTGQYAMKMRELGYKNRIISFEPLNGAFMVLKENALKDDKWIVNNYALGDQNCKTFINVAENSFSSSILNMLPNHIKYAPNSKYVSQQEIDIKKLDTIFNNFCNEKEKVMLKIDTQGYEKNVIDGAIESLKTIEIVQLEMSIVQLYENEILFIEMIEYLRKLGFMLFSLENGFSNPTTGQLLQVDGIFVKNDSGNESALN